MTEFLQKLGGRDLHSDGHVNEVTEEILQNTKLTDRLAEGIL